MSTLKPKLTTLFSFVAQAATGFYGAKAPQAFYCIAKKSKQKTLVPINRSAYRNSLPALHSTLKFNFVLILGKITLLFF